MMTATASWDGDGLRHEVDVNGRHTIVTDEPVKLGGGDEGPTPHELLAAALASCISTMIAMYARNRNWQMSGTRVEVRYEPDAAPRTFTAAIHLPAGMEPDQYRRLERVAESCPVRRALEAHFDFQEELVVADADDSAFTRGQDCTVHA
jgi:putative redox protein